MKLLSDLLPVIFFFAAYKLYGIYAATAVLIAATGAQVGWQWFRHRHVERMPLITAVLVLVLGGATLLLQDETFVKWKPTVVNWLFGLVFLGSQYVGDRTVLERMLGDNLELPAPVWRRLNLAWAGFFAVMGIVNLYVAYTFSTDIWVDFKLFGMLGLTIVFVIGQSLYLGRYLKLQPEAPASKE